MRPLLDLVGPHDVRDALGRHHQSVADDAVTQQLGDRGERRRGLAAARPQHIEGLVVLVKVGGDTLLVGAQLGLLSHICAPGS